MKKVICTICLLWIVIAAGCTEPQTATHDEYPEPNWEVNHPLSPMSESEPQEKLSDQEKESIQRFGHKYGLAKPKKLQPKKLQPTTEFEKLHQIVQDKLRDGTFHSIHPTISEVRIDPLIWSLLDIEAKRGLILFFEKYFDLHPDGIGVATIRSKYNDEKLGATGWFGGYKIYK